jgi:hypothetical protein
MLLKAEHREADPPPRLAREKIDEMAAKPPGTTLRNCELIRYVPVDLPRDGSRQRREKCDWDLERRDSEGSACCCRKYRRCANWPGCSVSVAGCHRRRKLDEALRPPNRFHMARHVGIGPTLIQSLVGMALFNIFAGFEELTELPKCPNLYWSRPRCRVRSSTRRPSKENALAKERCRFYGTGQGPSPWTRLRSCSINGRRSLEQIAGGELECLNRLAVAALVAPPSQRAEVIAALGKPRRDQ